MIGWRRCSPACECQDEDDCERAPKNVAYAKKLTSESLKANKEGILNGCMGCGRYHPIYLCPCYHGM